MCVRDEGGGVATAKFCASKTWTRCSMATCGDSWLVRAHAPPPELVSQLAQRGLVMKAFPTSEAVKRINELVRVGPTDCFGALHLTC
jgi:hypothetical protein